MSSDKIADFWNEASSTSHPPPLKRETVPLVLPKREYEEPVRKRRRLTEDSSTQLSSQQKRRNRPKYRLTLSRFSLPCIYPDCHQKFHFTQSLYGHIKSDHSPGVQCPYCTWEWNKTSYVELVRHARTHTTHKPYVCPFSDCEYAARNKRELQQHLMSSIHELSVNTRTSPYRHLLIVSLVNCFQLRDVAGITATDHVIGPHYSCKFADGAWISMGATCDSFRVNRSN